MQNVVICQWRAEANIDLSVSGRSKIIIDLRDTDKSRYFAITEFNNCFIIGLPSLFFNEYLRETKRSAIEALKTE